MSKFGIGVGEEFPVDDAPPPKTPPEGENWRPRHSGWHFFFHVVAKLALVALVIGGLFWLFHAPGYGYFHGPYAFTPYPHHFFFFPFFPILFLVLLIGFAFRRHHHYGYGCRGDGFRRWHDELHHERGDKA